jgi:predicted ATPase/class 3 adenylate cyclase
VTTTVFLFTDIEGSTRLWADHPDGMGAALERHDGITRHVVHGAGGQVFKHTGDGAAATFDDAAAAVLAAVELQRRLGSTDWRPLEGLRVRVGIHAGEAREREGDWFGPALNRAARLVAVGHGGQVLLSAALAALVRGSLPAAHTLIDLGVHRLRDLAEPEHVWQVGAPGLAATFPPLRSLDAAATNLPSQLSSFLGREGELRDLGAVLAQQRLVTLTGPGGVGKTRLALQAAADALQTFPDGVWVCELANVFAADALDHAVLAALGFVSRPGATARMSLIEALAHRELLLVMDNCEHLRDASADLVGQIARSARRVRVLATSREPLGLAGEQIWAVSPLDADDEAVNLFAERAMAVRRQFVLGPAERSIVADICRQLDGVPLAIELAAARTRSLSLADIRDRLGERFRLLTYARSDHAERRHAGLRTTLDWSYSLLATDEQALFDRLSVFVGGFDLAAAAAIDDRPDVDEFDLLEVLTALVDKSMVQVLDGREASRYRLLETMRYYGSEHLRAAGCAEEVGHRHATYFAHWLEQAAERLRGPDEAAWSRALEADFDNLRVAARWALDHADTDVAIRLTAWLWMFAIDHLLLEPAEWAEDALRLPGAADHPLGALVHTTAGFGAACAGRYDEALSHGESAIRLASANSSRHLWVALHLGWAGALALDLRDRLRGYADGSVRSALALADDYATCRSAWTQLLVHRVISFDIDVEASLDRCLELAQQIGNPTLLARAHILAGIVSCPADPAAGVEHFAIAEELARQVGARLLIGYGMTLGAIARSLQDPAAGLRALLRSLEWHQSGATPHGATHIVLRDLLPALVGMGEHRLVVFLDDHLPGAGLIQPEANARAVTIARDVLGCSGHDPVGGLSGLEVLGILRHELTSVLDASAALPPGST